MNALTFFVETFGAKPKGWCIEQAVSALILSRPLAISLTRG